MPARDTQDTRDKEQTMRLLPTVPGKVEGIVNLDPPTLQCQECGELDTLEAHGMRSDPERLGLLVVLSKTHFHGQTWPDGHTDNPRLCRSCRIKRGCRCSECKADRTGSYY